MKEALEEIAKEIEKALFLKYDQRQPCLDAAYRIYIEAFKAAIRDNKRRERVYRETDLLVNVISQCLENPTLHASSYALNGLRYVALKVSETYDNINKEQADELYEHLNACDFMTWGIGSHTKLAEYDKDVPDGYVDQQMAAYHAEEEAHFKKFKEEHPDAFKDY